MRLGTLNVWGLPRPVSRDPDARIRAIAVRLGELELDALAFQEVWTESAREKLLAGAASAGLVHAWHREATFGGSGLLVVSRWPIREARFQLFALCGLPHRLHHADYYGGKGYAELLLDTPEGPLALIDTHLHAAYGHRGFDDEYLGHRVAEMLELATAVAANEEPLVLLGDLNCVETSDEMRVLLGLTGLLDAAAILDARAPTILADSIYQRDVPPPGERIDYVLLRAGRRRGLRARAMQRVFDETFVVEGRPATYSDHAGLIAEVRLEGPGSPLPSPSAKAAARARALLEHGRGVALERRGELRAIATAGAALGIAAGVGAVGAARRSRRDWLRTGLGLLAGAALLPTLALAGVAEGFTPVELAAYDEADELAKAFAARAQPSSA